MKYHLMSTPAKKLLLAAAFITLLSPLGVAYAGSQPYNTEHQINFGTGNKYLTATDIRISSPGNSFTFTRTYNSQSDQTATIGYGWTMTGTDKLTVSGDKLLLTQAGGRVVYFEADGSGGWLNQTGSKRKISSNADGYALTEMSGRVRQFSTTGELVSDTDRNGNSKSFTYTGGLLDTITDNYGLLIDYEYTNGVLTSISTPVGSYVYGYTDGNLTSVTKPDTTSIQYIYDDVNDAHNLTGVIDESQARVLTVEYDTNDRATRSVKADGKNEITIEYPTSSERRITDSLQQTTVYQLEVKQGIVSVASMVGPGCSSCGSDSNETYTYNDRLQILTKTDGNEVVTSYTYDDDGNRNTTTKAVGTALETTVSKTYLSGTNLLQDVTKDSVSNPGAQKVTTYSRDANGNVTSIQEDGFDGTTAITKTTTYTYDSYGRIATVDGPRTDVNDIVTYAYYPNDAAQGLNRGFLHTITNALGHTITYENYNGYGQAERIVDANNIATTLTYYPNGLLDTRTTAGTTVDYDYYPNRSLEKVTLPGNRVVNYTYTSTGNLEQITDGLGNSIVYEYDSEGRKTGQKIKDALGVLTAYVDFQYDANGRLHKSINPDGGTEEYLYDIVGNLTTRIDPLNINTVYDYDAFNRLISVTEAGPSITSITYDKHGNQTSVTDAENNVTTFTYDDFGNRTSRTSPETGVTTYAYDQGGNLLSKTDANTTTVTYAYDALNRLTGVSYPDTTMDILYTYDQGENGIGRLYSVEDKSGNTVYSYDALGNVVQESRTIEDNTFVTDYTFNDNQEVQTITYPSGRIVEYVRDAIGQITGVTSTYNGITESLANSIAYKPFGPMATAALDNGLAVSNTYDQQYRLARKTVGSVYDRGYGFTLAGQVSTITDHLKPSYNQSFGYDDLGRLTSATGGYGTLAYGYDAVGNRLSMTTNGTVENYSYKTGSNQLDYIGDTDPVNYSYDLVGNITSDGSRQYSWDQENQLTSVSVGLPGTGGSYGYDARRLRVSKAAAGRVILYHYDAAGNLLTESDSTGTILREYVYVNGERLVLFEYEQQPSFTIEVVSSTNARFIDVDVAAYTEDLVYTETSSSTGDNGFAEFSLNDFEQTSYIFSVGYFGEQWLTEPTTVWDTLGLTIVVGVEPQHSSLPSPPTPVEPIEIKPYWYISDHIGSSQILTDNQGRVIWQGNYKPFGEVDVVLNFLPNNFRFPGQYYDEHTGLHYNWHRFYDPSTGRYISADPIGLAGGMNLYAYASQNPISFIDPFGLFTETNIGPVARPDINYPPFVLTDDYPKFKNTVTCKNGTPQPYLAATSPCLLDCQQDHEQAHVDQVNSISPGICSPGTDGMAITPQNRQFRDVMEERPLSRTLRCLYNKLKNMDECDECYKEIKDYIGQVLNQWQSYSHI